MHRSFGERLRSHREQQQIALSAIADQTKIKVSLLEALERDDVSSWPRGIYRRAYMRAYAAAIGLDPDAAVREFLELYPEQEEAVSAALEQQESDQVSRRLPARLRSLIDSAIGSLPTVRVQLERKNRLAGPHAAKGRGGRAPDGDRGGAPNGSGSWLAGARAAGEAATAGVEIGAVEVGGVEEDRQGEPAVAASEYEYLPFAVDAAVPAPETDGELPGNLATEPACDLEVDAGEAHLPGAAPRDDEPAWGEPAPARAPFDPDLSALADLCTRLARATAVHDVAPVLDDAARILDAEGLIVWMRDPQGRILSPVLAHGYSDEMLAQVPYVRADADNAIASSFRSMEPLVVEGSGLETGAVVSPIVTPWGCAGVLALELRPGAERLEFVRASAAILAAQLSALVAAPAAAEAVPA